MQSDKAKKRVFSGIQPLGKLHIGNYVGASSLWGELQDIYENMFCVVDLHALTIPEHAHPARLPSKSREVAALSRACGVDPSKNAVFMQSHIHEHTELAWVLNCITPVGWLVRMTQYKMKAKQSRSVSSALLEYHTLQAADILLYKTDLVPLANQTMDEVRRVTGVG